MDLTSSKETPATEPITSPDQKMEDENLAETSILKASFVGDKDPNANFNVKVPTLEECMEKFHKKIKTAGLLEIVYEIVKVAGELVSSILYLFSFSCFCILIIFSQMLRQVLK